MKKSLPAISIMVLSLFTIACNQSLTKEATTQTEWLARADSTAFHNDIEPLNSASRKWWYKADVHARVQSVMDAQRKLASLTAALNGVVISSSVSNDWLSEQQRRISYDSLLTARTYRTAGHFIIRVPVQYKDSLMEVLYHSVSFVESSQQSMTDATYDYLRNALNNNVDERHTYDVPIKNSKSADSGTAINTVAHTIIDRRLHNLEILDLVTYATITIDLYQPDEIDYTISVHPKRIYDASIGSEILVALHGGWSVCKYMLCAVITIWPIVLLLMAVFFWKRKHNKGKFFLFNKG